MVAPATWRARSSGKKGKTERRPRGTQGRAHLRGEKTASGPATDSQGGRPDPQGAAVLQRTPLQREVAEIVRLKIPELLVASPCSGNRRARLIGEGDTGGGAWLGDGRRCKGGTARVRVGPRGGGGGLNRAGRTCWRAGHA
jgi:hypothetical protein